MFNSLRNKIIVILGITFKAKTNDTRESAALDVIKKL
jgi:UDPglucose 6-dehydrogenase